uniref:Uncharacterized protein n=1 Tax=Oryza rufipogon TaxID=4529 RepID=A0A0E0MZQ4_ORYRU
MAAMTSGENGHRRPNKEVEGTSVAQRQSSDGVDAVFDGEANARIWEEKGNGSARGDGGLNDHSAREIERGRNKITPD